MAADDWSDDFYWELCGPHPRGPAGHGPREAVSAGHPHPGPGGHRLPRCTVVLAIRLPQEPPVPRADIPARWSASAPAARGGRGAHTPTPTGDSPKAKDQGRKAGPGRTVKGMTSPCAASSLAAGSHGAGAHAEALSYGSDCLGSPRETGNFLRAGTQATTHRTESSQAPEAPKQAWQQNLQ